MKLNWITFVVAFAVILILYAIYKIIGVIRDINELKQNVKTITYTETPQICPAPNVPKPPQNNTPTNPPPKEQTLEKNTYKQPTIVANPPPPPQFIIQQPKLKKPVIQQQLTTHKYEETSDKDSDIESLYHESDEFDNDMVIPIDLTSILEKVVTNRFTEQPQIIEHADNAELDEHVGHIKHDENERRNEESQNIESIYTESSLKTKTISELKDIARSMNIKLTDGGKPKNKETLIKEISTI